MPAQLVKTSTPGIFKRGNRYVFSTASTTASTVSSRGSRPAHLMT